VNLATLQHDQQLKRNVYRYRLGSIISKHFMHGMDWGVYDLRTLSYGEDLPQ
jgi:hypothetical protein